jgi:hypothetical protein
MYLSILIGRYKIILSIEKKNDLGKSFPNEDHQICS